jgi:hypothetical protein
MAVKRIATWASLKILPVHLRQLSALQGGLWIIDYAKCRSL